MSQNEDDITDYLDYWDEAIKEYPTLNEIKDLCFIKLIFSKYSQLPFFESSINGYEIVFLMYESWIESKKYMTRNRK